ncbi:helix-turn-helix domain-containing protein [Curtobacterium sp. 314Chir4.1]|uniref:helix-turn-helix domain-containing protein n=1 Tax=Curtobacterium sp. 314Chir4.1 TaxID=1279028 RepID=UPI0026AFDDC6
MPEPLWRHVVGRQLRERRRGRGDTLQHVAKRAGVSPQYLSEIERGRKEPSSERIAAVAGALDTSLLDLTLGAADDLRASRAPDSVAQVRVDFALAA